MLGSTTRTSIRFRGRRERGLLLACLILSAALPGAAEAGAPPSAADSGSSALAELFVNGESFGNIEFRLDDSQSPLLPPAVVRRALAGIARPELVDAAAEGAGPVGAPRLEALGLALAYDPNLLRLSLDVPPRDLIPVDIGSPRGAAPAKGETLIADAGFAAMLGLGFDAAPRYAAGPEGGGAGNVLSLELSPAIRAFDIVAEGDGTVFRDEEWRATIYAARLVRDFPRLGARASLGIVSVATTGFQGSQELWGIGFSREDEAFGAARGSRRIVDEFVLERNARVTVEVNGAVFRKLALGPGSYRLSDLPLSSGLNEAEVLIEEEGREPRRATLGLPFDSEILEPGDIDYALALGAVRDDAKEPFGAGRLAYGVAPELELGADLEAGYSIFLGGLSALWATAWGSWGAAAAVALPYSEAEGRRSSVAARAYWRYFYPRRRYVPRAGAAVEFRGPGFAAPRGGLDLESPASSASWNLSAQLSENLPRAGSLAALGSLSLEAGAARSGDFTLGATVPIGSATTLYLSGGFDWNQVEGYAPRLSALLTVTTPGRATLQYRQDFLEYGNSIAFGADIDGSGRGKLSLSADNVLAKESDSGASLGGRLRSRVVNLSALGRYYRPADGSYSEYSGDFGASTNLVYAGGTFGAASDLGDAVALVVPPPVAGLGRIELRSAGGAKTAIEGSRAAVIPSIKPYKSFVASVEMPESPPEIRPSSGSIEFMPAYRSVTLVKIALASSIGVGARLVSPDGAVRRNLSGSLAGAPGAAIPFAGTFADDEGVFECFGLPAGPATITWSDGSRSSFTVPEGNPGAFFDIGDVAAAPPEEGESP